MRRFVLVLALALPRLAAADGPKLTLDQVIGKAIANPRVEMAQGDQAAAEARLDEADASRLPRVKGTAFGTPLSRYAYEDPRQYSFSLGVRF